MYNKKYRLVEIESYMWQNPLHEQIKGRICYLAYLNEGERGWFLAETDDMFKPVHRIHTSKVKDIQHPTDNQIVVRTQNTKYVFELVMSEADEEKVNVYE